MIKRPLLIVLGAYLFGIYAAWYSVPFVIIIFSILLFYLLIYNLMFRVTNAYINRYDYFLWVVPMILILGVLVMGDQMKRPEIEFAFEERAKCELTGEVSMIVEKNWGKVLYLKNNYIQLSREGPPYFSERIIVQCYEEEKYQIGNIITVYGEIQKFLPATNLGQFNEKMYYQIQNVDYRVKSEEIQVVDANYSKFYAFFYHLKRRLLKVYDEILPEREAGAIKAMLLGEKYLLETELKQLYQANGISHILAISGLHISLIGISIYKLLKRMKIPILPSTIISIGIIYCYGILTNFSVSTNRAVVMLILLLLSRVFGKTYDIISAISLSAFLILLNNPMQIFHVGFLLSFGAVLGIAIIHPCLQILFPFKHPIISSIFVSSSIQIITLPIILSFYFQLPLYSVLINLLILPCMAVLVLTALVAGLVGLIHLPLGIFMIGGARYLLWMIEIICKLGSQLPENLITIGKPDAIRIIVYLSLIILFIWVTHRYGKKLAIAIPIIAIILLIIPQSNAGLEITMLDVGQGEAIVMRTDSGSTYLIDGGSSNVGRVGTYRILPFLQAKGIREIEYVFITHMHDDHINGIKELIEGSKIKIKHVVLPNISSKNDSYMKFENLIRSKGITLLYIEAGDFIQDGNVQITCLHPSSDFHVSSINSYSAVLSVSIGEFNMLLTGDLELNGEKALVDLLHKNGGVLNTDYNVLKVAHHGSKNSTYEEFLQIVKPEYSLISCGKNNRYGHPHEELLFRLHNIGSNVYVTSETGAITIRYPIRYLVPNNYQTIKTFRGDIKTWYLVPNNYQTIKTILVRDQK